MFQLYPTKDGNGPKDACSAISYALSWLALCQEAVVKATDLNQQTFGTVDRLVLAELSHRMLDELRGATEIFEVDKHRCSDVDSLAAPTRASDQLYAVAEAHWLLAPPDLMCMSDTLCDLQRVCDALSRARARSAGIELVVIDNPLPLNQRQAWLFSLVVSELITNAARHASDDGAGQVEVKVPSSCAFATCEVSDGGMAEATWGDRESANPICGCEIAQDRVRLLDDDAVILNHGHLAMRVHRQEFRRIEQAEIVWRGVSHE